MNKMIWRIFVFLLFAYLPFLDTESAISAPFKTNPQSFASWFNSLNYSIKLMDLSGCSYRNEGKVEGYECYGGYATINDRLGKRVCPIRRVAWVRNEYLKQNSQGASVIEEKCRWKN